MALRSQLWSLPLLFAVAGCAGPENPSFPLSVKEAKAALDQMRAEPVAPARPLVVLAGCGDPGYVDSYLRKQLEPCFTDARIAAVHFTGASTFDDCRQFLIDAVDEQFGTEDPRATVEVDVVANSMGGLIAVYAADPSVGDRSLRVARMFTLSTPFLGAEMARLNIGSQLLVDMRPGSAFLEGLNQRNLDPPYALVPYVRLGDRWVGERNTAPPGRMPWWVSNRPFEPAHLAAFSDPRILADVARRLRGETPFTTEPPAPWP